LIMVYQFDVFRADNLIPCDPITYALILNYLNAL
jgi:hypothetical protein